MLALQDALGAGNPFSLLAEAIDAHAILAVTDSAGRITYANDTFCRLSKYSAEELVGQDHRLLNSGHHPSAFFRDLWNTILAGGVWRGEIRNRAKDGSLYWVLTTIQPFQDASGNLAGFISLRSDITAQKRVQEALAADEERIEMILESANLGAFQFSSRLAAVHADRRLRQIFGVEGLEALTLEVLLSTIHPDDVEEVRHQLQQALTEPGPHHAKFRLYRPLGEHRWVRCWGRSHPSDGGHMWVDGVALDVTEQINTFDNLKALQAILPMCAWCKKIRNDEGYWQQVEQYFLLHRDQAFSHGICPECSESLKDTPEP